MNFWSPAGVPDLRLGSEHDSTPAQSFRFGDGYLQLYSSPCPFRGRFHDVYRECAVASTPEDGYPLVTCRIDTEGNGRARITFDDPEPHDDARFAVARYGPIGFRRMETHATGGQVYAAHQVAGAVRFRPNAIDADAPDLWKSLVGALVVHRVLRLQPSNLVFHAASVAVGGYGVLLIGPKRSGKTTLTMALGAGGHTVLGDEYAVVRRESLHLLPFRRRMSVRAGPCHPAALRSLEQGNWATRRLADGTTRTLVHVDRLWPGPPPRPVPLRAIVFLRPRRGEARVVRLAPAREHLAWMTPFDSMFWNRQAGRVAMDLIEFLHRVPSFALWPGDVVTTAGLIEHLPGLRAT